MARSRALLQRHEEMISAISRLVGAGFRKISAAEDEIDRRVSRFSGQSLTLLIASLGLVLVCLAMRSERPQRRQR